MTEKKEKHYGSDISVRPTQFDEKGQAHEYRVFQGNFCVKILHDGEEADDYARRLAERRKDQ